jgi:hypothetical protein
MGLFDAITSLFDPSAGSDAGVGIFSAGLGELGPLVSELGTPMQPNYVPTYDFGAQSPPPAMGYPMVANTPVMSSVPMIGGGSAAMRAVGPILFAIARTLGLKGIPSVSRAMEIVRRMAKYLSPAATAAAIGISLADLGMLMAVSNRRKRRRMNPANTKALRRSLRRLGGFEKLAHRVSAQLGRTASKGRRRSVGRCRTCRKNPCSC